MGYVSSLSYPCDTQFILSITDKIFTCSTEEIGMRLKLRLGAWKMSLRGSMEQNSSTEDGFLRNNTRSESVREKGIKK